MNSALLRKDSYGTQGSSNTTTHKKRLTKLPTISSDFFSWPSSHDDIMERSSAHTYPISHPVWGIKIDKVIRSLTKPVVLKVMREGNQFFAENDNLDVCGYGSTPGEALEQAIKDLSYYYSHYGALDDNQVVGLGVEMKGRYATLIAD